MQTLIIWYTAYELHSLLKGLWPYLTLNDQRSQCKLKDYIWLHMCFIETYHGPFLRYYLTNVQIQGSYQNLHTKIPHISLTSWRFSLTYVSAILNGIGTIHFIIQKCMGFARHSQKSSHIVMNQYSRQPVIFPWMILEAQKINLMYMYMHYDNSFTRSSIVRGTFSHGRNP